jgi:thioredoxin 1
MTENDKQGEPSSDNQNGQKPSLPGSDGRSQKKPVFIGVVLAILVLGFGGMVWYDSGKEDAAPKPSSSQNAVPLQAGQDQETMDKAFSSDTVLATVNNETIRLQDLDALLTSMPESQRKGYARDKQALLELLIKQILLLQEAERKGITGGTSSAAGPEDDAGKEDAKNQRIQAILSKEVLNDVRVSESDLRTFYEKNKEQMPKDSSFEEIKGQIRRYALQMKQQQAVDEYIGTLMGKASITRNQDWIEARKTAMANTPLSRALETGRPVLADFGRGTCVPCKMMEPILKELKKKYKGEAEILILDVGEYPRLTRKAGIRTIPTQIFYDATGKEVSRHQGFMDKESIIKEIEKLRNL